ncbi:MAG: hypothetical protein HYY06_17835 [Deltaproteobacteria bacterium]|nr:hypothetical protein [Deltaproteobacteria bacterium]
MDSRRRGGAPGDTAAPAAAPAPAPAAGPRAAPREGTGALRFWSEDPLRDGTPPHGSIDPALGDTIQVVAPPEAPAAPSADMGPEPQAADEATQPDVAIWDRAFVSEPKTPALILGPDSEPLALAGEGLGPTVAVRTGEIDAMVTRRTGRRRLAVAAVAVVVLLGSGATIFAVRRLADSAATEELAQALHRSDADSVASNLEALEALEGLNRRYPDRSDIVDALAERSALYALRFDPAGAAAERARALAKRRGRSAGLAVARAATALLDGDRARAESIAGRVSTAALAYVRAHARLRALEHEAAIADLAIAARMEPTWGGPVALEAEAERLAGRLVDARETLARLRRLAPHSTELPVVEALVEVDAALTSMSAEALESAQRRVGEALATNDSRARVPAGRLRLALARLALAHGEAGLAQETSRPVEELLQGWPEFVRVQAQAQSASGSPGEALATLASSPAADLEARWLRVLALLQLERPEAALDAASGLGAAGAPERLAIVRDLAAWSSLEGTDRFERSRPGASNRPATPSPLETQVADEAEVARLEALTERGEWNDVRTAVQALGVRSIRRCGQAILSAMWANDARARENLGGDGRSSPLCGSRLEGRLALSAGEVEAAVVHLRKAAASGRPSDRVALAEGIWRTEGGAAAVAEAKIALGAKPTASRTLLPLVDLFARLGATASARRAAELSHEEPARIALVARGLRLAGDGEGARQVLAEPAAARWADHPLVALEVLHSALARGDTAAALEASPSALRAPTVLWLESVQVTVQALRGAGREEDADALVDGELQAASNRGDRRRVHGLRLLRARLSIERGDPASLHRASNDLSFVETQMQKPSAEAKVLLARLALTRDERTEAARLNRAALAMDPTRQDAYAALEELHVLGSEDRSLHDRSWPSQDFD